MSPRGVLYIWVVVREIFNLFVSFGKYALVRFVSAVTCCDGGLPEGSDVYEATGYILELHQPNVSTAVICRYKTDHPFAATAKHENNIDMNSPDWVQVKIQYGYCYRSFCQRLRNLLCVETGFKMHEGQGKGRGVGAMVCYVALSLIGRLSCVQIVSAKNCNVSRACNCSANLKKWSCHKVVCLCVCVESTGS